MTKRQHQNQNPKVIRQQRRMNRLKKERNDIDIGWFYKIATSDNRKIVTKLNLHEIRNEILGDCGGDFGRIGDSFVKDDR